MSRQQRSGLRFQSSKGQARNDVPVGKKQELDIERLAHDGRGIAFFQGRTWFVSGAMPNERVIARVLSARNKVVDAQTLNVLKPTAERITPFCSLAGQCGGCTLQHMPIAQQRRFKQEAVLNQLQRAGVEVAEVAPLVHGEEQGYRCRTRLAVKVDEKGQVKLGFRALASQAIVSVEQCPILVEPLRAVLPSLTPLLHSLARADAIGHLELFRGNATVLLVRLNRALSAEDEQKIREYCTTQAIQLWWQTKAEPYPDAQEQALFYELPEFGLQVDYRPGDFVQVNPAVNRQMVQQALNWLELRADEYVLDLYCGLGNFSLPLAQAVQSVTAVEGVETMVQRAQQTALRQGIENIEFMCADLSQAQSSAAWAKQVYSAVVLDPPRDGADEVVKQLATMPIERILYVSCNPATLARDAATLQEAGYQLKRLAALDMFSQTGHVEAMTLFVRRK